MTVRKGRKYSSNTVILEESLGVDLNKLNNKEESLRFYQDRQVTGDQGKGRATKVSKFDRLFAENTENHRAFGALQ